MGDESRSHRRPGWCTDRALIRGSVNGGASGRARHGARLLLLRLGPRLRGVSFLLDDARTALVGENGAGKSTLLKCLTGALELNGGQVIRSRGLRVGSVPQDVPDGLAGTTGARRAAALAGADRPGRRLVAHRRAGSRRSASSRTSSTGSSATLSGGWQRLMLIAAAARLEEPDILILDEPTNHLDLANINTLERWLTVEFADPDADRQPRPRDPRPRDRAHPVPAQRRRACLQDPLLGRARGAAAPRRHRRGARAAGGEGDQAARAGGGALQGLGGQEPRPQQAQERRRDPHRPHRGRAHADLRRARAAAGAQRRRHRREGGAAAGRSRA